MKLIIFMFIMIILLSFFISMLIMKISMVISLKMKLNLEKMSPFECGFNPIFNKRMPFSIRFFLILIVFLIFDMEIALILPMIVSMNFSMKKMWFMSSMTFMVILMAGLFYEWKNGALNWI